MFLNAKQFPKTDAAEWPVKLRLDSRYVISLKDATILCSQWAVSQYRQPNSVSASCDWNSLQQGSALLRHLWGTSSPGAVLFADIWPVRRKSLCHIINSAPIMHHVTTKLMWRTSVALLAWYGSSESSARKKITGFSVFLRHCKRFNRDTAHTTKCSSSVLPRSSPDLPAMPRQRSKVETKGEAGRL